MANNSTSIEAFYKPGRRTWEDRVFESLRDSGPATRLDLSKRLDKAINYITSPVLNLIKAGLIVEDARVVQPETGTRAWRLKLKDAAE